MHWDGRGPGFERNGTSKRSATVGFFFFTIAA
jgi:hypothetical protein